jgi:hypothetical protein
LGWFWAQTDPPGGTILGTFWDLEKGGPKEGPEIEPNPGRFQALLHRPFEPWGGPGEPFGPALAEAGQPRIAQSRPQELLGLCGRPQDSDIWPSTLLLHYWAYCYRLGYHGIGAFGLSGSWGLPGSLGLPQPSSLGSSFGQRDPRTVHLVICGLVPCSIC